MDEKEEVKKEEKHIHNSRQARVPNPFGRAGGLVDTMAVSANVDGGEGSQHAHDDERSKQRLNKIPNAPHVSISFAACSLGRFRSRSLTSCWERERRMSASDGANESYFFWRACQISGPPSRRAASIARSAQSCGDRAQSPPGGSQKAGARGLFTGPVTEAVSRGLTAAPAHVQQQFRPGPDAPRQGGDARAVGRAPAGARARNSAETGAPRLFGGRARPPRGGGGGGAVDHGQAEGGARALSQLTITLPTGDPAPVMVPLVHALGAGGGAPNLTSLELCGVGRKAMEDVAPPFAPPGGLTRL